MNRREFLVTPLAFAAAINGQPVRASPKRPNVVLIVGASWRAQCVPWGRGPDTNVDVVAPNLDRFAARSVRFSRAYACYSRSDRARLCLLKGVFPHALAGPDATTEELAAESPSLGAVLRGAGYRTASFTNLQSDDLVSFVHEFTPEPFYAEWTFENLGAGLMERFNPDALHLRGNVPAENQEKARDDLATFYARAKTRDHDIGIVLEAIDRPGIVSDTIVVFTSDHGEQFGSHGVEGDGFPYEECVRIPLAIHYPRALAGADSNLLISQPDIVPTLLRLCGVAIPSTVQGRDLAGALLGKSGDASDSIYVEGGLTQRLEWRMLVRGFDKIVIEFEGVSKQTGDGRVTHLYNLADDPLELNNLANASSETLKRDALIAAQKALALKLGDGADASGLRKR